MSLFMKIIAVLMFPLSILIIIKKTNIISLNVTLDIAFIGAITMIIFQIINHFLTRKHNEKVGIMQSVTSIIFIIPAVAYIVSIYIVPILPEFLEVILGVMMFVESLYALH